MYVSNGAAARGIAARRSRSGRRPTCSAWRCWRGSTAIIPGYSRVIAAHHDYLTWAILKAHTSNRAGEVTLRSADPRDHAAGGLPLFRGGQRPGGDDLRAVVDGDRASCASDDAGLAASA